MVDPSQIDGAGQLQDNPCNQFLQPPGQQQTNPMPNQQHQSSTNNQDMTLAIPTRIGHLYLMVIFFLLKSFFYLEKIK